MEEVMPAVIGKRLSHIVSNRNVGSRK